MTNPIYIPGFNATVLRNGAPVRFKDFNVSFDAGKLGAKWDITMPEPIIVSNTDRWSILISFAGYSRYLVTNAPSEVYSGSDEPKTSTTKVSSQSMDTVDSDVLNNFGIPKTFVFVSPAWLKETSSFIDGATGIVMHYDLNPDVIRDLGLEGVFVVPPKRFYHPKLPGQDRTAYADGSYDFKCFAAHSHQDIARQLCNMLGIRFSCNLPDVPLIDVCSFESGSKWFDCIKRNFLMWGPSIQVVLDSAGNTTVLVEDVYKSSGGIAATETVYIGNPSIRTINRQLSRPSDDRLVDHVIIIGRKSKDTTIISRRRPDFTPIELPCVEFEPSFWMQADLKTEPMNQHKKLGSYTGSFNSGDDEFTVKPVLANTKWVGYHEWDDGKQTRRIPVREETHAYSADGEVSKTITRHYYAPDKSKVTKTSEEHFFKTNMPGSKSKSMEKLRVKTTLQNSFLAGANLTLTKEMIEDVVIYSESIEQVGGQPTAVKSDPKPLIEALKSNANYVEKDPNTTQKTLEMTTYSKFTHIDRVDDKTLIKNDVSYDVLAQNLPQVNSQILDNPIKDPQPIVTEKDNIFRREYKDPRSQGTYFRGKGPFYHPAKTIQHEDICTDEMANAIALRVFYRRNQTLSPTIWEISLNVKVPVSLDFVTSKVRIDDLTWVVNGAEVTIPGGTYNLKRVSYKVSTSGKSVTFDEDVTIGN